VIQVDKDQNTLLELVSKAGGFEMYANLKSVKILRQEGENVRVTNIDLTKMKDIPNQNIVPSSWRLRYCSFKKVRILIKEFLPLFLLLRLLRPLQY
jgi:hypothetical protein